MARGAPGIAWTHLRVRRAMMTVLLAGSSSGYGYQIGGIDPVGEDLHLGAVADIYVIILSRQ